MRYILAIGLAVGLSAFAHPGDWTKSFASDGCGFSEAEAKAEAGKGAQNEANFYESVCKGAQGAYSVKLSGGTCTPNPQDLTCRFGCSISGTASCTF